MERPIASVDGVLVHLPPPGRRRGQARPGQARPEQARPGQGQRERGQRRQVRTWPGPWLVVLGGLVAALGLVLWARPWLGPLAGTGYGVGGMALFGLGGVAMVAGLALTMADRAERRF